MAHNPINPTGRQLVTRRDVATRYRIHINSVPRWVANGVIPASDQNINGRHYWYVDTLDEADRVRTKAAARRRLDQKSAPDHEPPPETA